MIIGIGSDVVDIRRIERTLDRFGARFTSRVFTEIDGKIRSAADARCFLRQALCRQGSLL